MKHLPTVIASGLATLLITLSSAPLQAQNLYRYVNAEGNTVLSGSLPPEYADKGYEVINRHGRVIQFVSPKPTQKQLQALELEAEALKNQAAQEQRDNELLLLYGSVQEARDALKRQMNVIKGQLALSEAEATRFSFILKQKQEQVKKLKQSGRTPSEQLTDTIADLKDDIDKNQQKTSDQLENMEALRQRFLGDIERLELLRGSRKVAAGQSAHLNVSRRSIAGNWQSDTRLSWQLNPDGSFRSTEHQLNSALDIETLGQWQLNGRLLTISVNRLNITDARGKTNSKRVSQEQRGEILAADGKQLEVRVDGRTLKMGRP